MCNGKRMGPSALSKHAEYLFKQNFPEAKPFFIKGKYQKGAFRLNRKIVLAKWASFTKGNGNHYKAGWGIMFPANYDFDLAVVFIERKFGDGIGCPDVLIVPRSDFPNFSSKRFSEQDEEYIYKLDDIRDAVLMNLEDLETSKHVENDRKPCLGTNGNDVTSSETLETKGMVMGKNKELTIEVSPIDYLAFKQIASVKKKGQQLLFHDMLEVYWNTKCENISLSNLINKN